MLLTIGLAFLRKAGQSLSLINKFDYYWNKIVDAAHLSAQRKGLQNVFKLRKDTRLLKYECINCSDHFQIRYEFEKKVLLMSESNCQ